jgi:hypothetical protein
MEAAFTLALMVGLIILIANISLISILKGAFLWRDVHAVSAVFAVVTLGAFLACDGVASLVGGGGDGLGGETMCLYVVIAICFVGIVAGFRYFGVVPIKHAVLCAVMSLLLLWALLWHSDYIFWWVFAYYYPEYYYY